MSEAKMESMSLQEVRENLPDLVKLVAQGKKRIEMTGVGNDKCVLVSKVELDSLEQAIAILADTNEFRTLSQSLNQLAAATDQPAMA